MKGLVARLERFMGEQNSEMPYMSLVYHVQWLYLFFFCFAPENRRILQ